MANCKKCKTHMVPKEIKIAMNRSGFVCPVCNHNVRNFDFKGLLIFVGIIALVLALLSLHHHLTS